MPLKTQLDDQPTLNLTPMIDVVFLLIIFFMLGSNFGDPQRKMSLSVPEVADHESLDRPPKSTMVGVLRNGTILLNDEVVTEAELIDGLGELIRRNPKLKVLIRGAGKVEYERVAQVLRACKTAGVRQLDVAVQAKRPE